MRINPVLENHFALKKPTVVPTLDPDFRPAALADRAWREAASGAGIPLVVGLERENGNCSRVESRIFPETDPRAGANLWHAQRLVRILLWSRGAHRITVGGPAALAESIRRTYAPDGERKFEHGFFGRQVYETPLTVVSCPAEEVPPARENPRPLGRHLDGCRIGFDLGASDRKVSAVVDGKVVFSDETVWEPRKHADPEYHYREIADSLRAAAAHLPRVDAIGGSSAGIYINNRPMVASLFRAVPPENYGEVRNLFVRIQREWNAPLEVINDGDVTALAGSMSLGDGAVLGIALGSGEAAGYVDGDGRITGWLNELGFAPFDDAPAAPPHEWSGDRGCGSQYLSQQSVFRLAPRAGIALPEGGTDAERLKFVQVKLEAGDAGAEKIWQTMGVYLGYAIALYAAFYQLRHVLILGRCTSGRGGSILLAGAQSVLTADFPEVSDSLQLHLPDEKSRRVGQAVAAASLPEIPRT
jgi:predicted NBD/HSP70 family sugar kinase